MNRLAPVCVLLAVQCPLCRSPVVWVRQEGSKDRLICPVCWAMGERGEGAIAMQRGLPIPAQLKYLVDKARFPRADAPAGGSPVQVVAGDAKPGTKQDPGDNGGS